MITGPLGVAQQRHRAVEHARRRAPRAGAGSRSAGSRLLGLHEHVVEREVEERRAGVRAQRLAPTRRRSAPGISAVDDAVVASLTSGRTNGTWSISCSDPWPQRIAGARPPSTSIGEWFCCAEPSALMPFVTPGPGGERAHARLARDLRPALGGERGGRLVAHVDELDALLAAAVVDREQVAAGEREQRRDAVRLQAAGDQAPAVQLASSPAAPWSWRGTYPPIRGCGAPARWSPRAEPRLRSRAWMHSDITLSVYTPFADLDLLSPRRSGTPRCRAARRRRRARARDGRRVQRADPRRARLARRALELRDARATRAAASASPTRRSPQYSARPTRSAGSRSAPAASSARPVASIAPSRPSSRAACEACRRARARGRGRLGEDLGIVEVEAAAERQPRRGEHEGGAATALGRVRGHAHRGRHGGREALRPDERQAQRGGALLGRAAHGRGGDVVVGQRAAAQRVGRRGLPDDLVEARSTRSAAR